MAALVLATGHGLCRAQPLPVEAAVAARMRVAAWQRLVQEHQLGTWEKLLAVNRFFNRFAQKDDIVVWGMVDYWATLDELLSIGAGDCEDLADAKYATLLKMGVPAARLQLAITRAFSPRTRRIERHVVVLYDDIGAGSRWVLDNLTDRVVTLESRTDLALLSLVEAPARAKTLLRVSTVRADPHD